MVEDIFENDGADVIETIENVLSQQIDEGRDALHIFRQLFGFAFSSLTNDLINDGISTSVTDENLSVPSQFFTDAQLSELSKLGNLLVSLNRKVESKTQSLKVITDKITSSSRDIIENQNRQHELILDELYHKFNRMEDTLVDVVSGLQTNSSSAKKRNFNTESPNISSSKKIIVSHSQKLVTVDKSFYETRSSRSMNEDSTSNKKSRRERPKKEKDDFHWIKDPVVRAKAKELAEASVNFDPKASPHSLLGRYVYRIFDNSNLCYGLLVQYEDPLFQVIYNDGDSQKLSLREVRLSLLNESLAPRRELEACVYHRDHKTYLSRHELPQICT